MNMKKRFFIFAAVLFAGIIAAVIFYTPREKTLLSPLVSKGVFAANLWFPEISANIDAKNAPKITAKAAYFVDTGSGRVLYQKNFRDKLPVASLTKIMTVIVTLENKSPEDTLDISEKAAGMEPDHMELIAGEKLTVEELLYGIFLVSANDAAEALAEGTTAGRDDFIEQMNITAKRLGMNDTLFINPSGLQEDDREQYSTAYDVALMSRYAIRRFPRVVDFSKTYHMVLPKTPAHQDYDLYSGINLLTTYPGVVGFKTGYTSEAGLTLVTLARVGGHEVLGVLLGSENRGEEAKWLLDYSFKELGVKTE